MSDSVFQGGTGLCPGDHYRDYLDVADMDMLKKMLTQGRGAVECYQGKFSRLRG